MTLLDKLQALEASPGPWIHSGYGTIDQFAPHPEGSRLMSSGDWDNCYHNFTDGDAALISLAPHLIPLVEVLQTVAYQSSQIAKAEGYRGEIFGFHPKARDVLAKLEEALDA